MTIFLSEYREAVSAKEAFEELEFDQIHGFREVQKPANVSDTAFEKQLKASLTSADPIAIYEIGGGDLTTSEPFKTACVERHVLSGEERWATVYAAYAEIEGFTGAGSNKEPVVVSMEIKASIFEKEVLEAAQKHVSETGESVEIRVEKRIVSDIYTENKRNVLKNIEAIPKHSQIKKWRLIGYVQK